MSNIAAQREKLRSALAHIADLHANLDAAHRRIEELEAYAAWVDTWVSNPVSSYSVSALDGIFAMTRDRLRTLAGGEHG